MAFGPLQARGVLRGFVDTIATPTTTVTAIPGTFSRLDLLAQGTSPEESRIFFNWAGAVAHQMQADGTGLRQINNLFGTNLDATEDGNQYVYTMRSPTFRLVVYDARTRAAAWLTTPSSTQDDVDPSIDPATSDVYFVRNEAGVSPRIMRVPIAGGTPTVVRTLTGTIRMPMVRDNRLYYWRDGQLLGGNSAPGSGDSSVIGGTFSLLDWDIDVSKRMIVVALGTISSATIRAYYITGVTTAFDIATAVPFSALAFSPTGDEVLASVVEGGQTVLRAYNLANATSRVLTRNHPPVENSHGLAWVKGPTQRALIGTDPLATLGTASDGVIFGRQNERATGVLSFDATTPSSVVMKAETGTPSGNPNTLGFSVDADAITGLVYSNEPFERNVQVVNMSLPITSATGFLVDFSNQTGQIGLVLPFTASRGISRSIRQEGSAKVFRGDFLGVFDSSGKNLAPSGAREVRVTGGAVEVR